MGKGDSQIFIKISIDSLVKESDKSFGFIENKSMYFIPKSQISDVKKDDHFISFWCPKWLVDQNRLEPFICTDYEPSLF